MSPSKSCFFFTHNLWLQHLPMPRPAFPRATWPGEGALISRKTTRLIRLGCEIIYGCRCSEAKLSITVWMIQMCGNSMNFLQRAREESDGVLECHCVQLAFFTHFVKWRKNALFYFLYSQNFWWTQTWLFLSNSSKKKNPSVCCVFCGKSEISKLGPQTIYPMLLTCCYMFTALSLQVLLILTLDPKEDLLQRIC